MIEYSLSYGLNILLLSNHNKLSCMINLLTFLH